MAEYKLLHGDCLDKLKELEDNSIDAVVTDPPYGLSFMGKKWDYDVPSQEIWEECMRVLKPGGHLLAFAGSRTYHRMAVRIEDAGFDIRDQIMWLYGSGFPKSHNIGKAVDKLQGNQRQVVGTKRGQGNIPNDRGNWGLKPNTDVVVDVGQSEYEGWGTALKPAHEPIVMARKPIKGSVAENVLEWGTGGINIDGCRIETDWKAERPESWFNSGKSKSGEPTYGGNLKTLTETTLGERLNEGGRFPANIILDEEAGKVLDQQSSITTSNNGASRFFYCPKVSKKERNEGVEGEDKIIKGRDEGQDKTSIAYKARPIGRKNIHPTVKPTDLMAYLIRLVTPKGGVVLDPFMGSGSTGKACAREGMKFVGIEMDEEYIEIAKQRVEYEYDKRKFF